VGIGVGIPFFRDNSRQNGLKLSPKGTTNLSAKGDVKLANEIAGFSIS
jgi:hypothetical protein